MAATYPRIQFLDKIGIGLALVRARLLGTFVPLLAGWSLTDRCQYRCSYCGLCGDGKNDLPFDRIVQIIDELKRAGCRRIQFTGGEPLLRDDLGDILEHCSNIKIATSVSTNGLLVPDQISALKHAGLVNISVDGPPEVHDAVRAEGSFHAIGQGAQALEKAGVPFRFAAVLHRENLSQIDFLLGLAANYKTLISFQPVTIDVLGQKAGHDLRPIPEKYRAAIDRLIEAHSKKAPIVNSVPGLLHLRKWPDPTNMCCVGGKIFLRIESNGDLVNCQRRTGEVDSNLATGDVADAINKVRAIGCAQCWSAPVVEAGCIMQGNLRTILHLNRIL
jgi:MoaA/NifB/PqqE/SkfB family radical SAM enzyme